MKIIRVSASVSYDVIISQGILDRAGEYFDRALNVVNEDRPRIAIVSDDKVFSLYGRRLIEALKGYDTVEFVFPNGEKSKNLHTYCELQEYLSGRHLGRGDVIAALGGGVVGDLAGFAAATYLRGIRFIQIPTTLLAAVDSSVGGKTAVDLEAGKNLCGAFWQPSAVLCDTDLLSTLSDEVFADGMGEVIKCGMIRSEELFDKLESYSRQDSFTEEMIGRCVEIKRDVVNADERDTGIRAILNFGHTAAHGIEKYSGYTVSHGSAVAVGMAIVTRAAEKRGFCRQGTAQRLCACLKKHGLPTSSGFTPEQLASAALSDKKRDKNSITMVLPDGGIGTCRLEKVPVDGLAAFFRDGM